MVPRPILLERLLDGFPTDRIRYNSRAREVVSTPAGVRVEFEDGSSAEADIVIGADGLHSKIRDIIGAAAAKPTGWCSWQGLVTLPDIADKHGALQVVGERGNVGVWPAGGSEVQWWFDLPWSTDSLRPQRPIEMIRSNFHRMVRCGRPGTRDIDRRGFGPFAVPALSASDSPPGRRRDYVARRRRAHDAAHSRAGDQSGAAGHDGVA